MNESGQIQILIAEDETPSLNALATYLSREDLEILLAKDGSEAIQMLEQNPSLDIVVTDLVMPGADGMAVLRKALESNTHKLVILMTGLGSLDTVVRAIDEGVFDYKGKPFLFEEMALSIQRAVAYIQLRLERDRLIRERDVLHERFLQLREELNRIKDRGPPEV